MNFANFIGLTVAPSRGLLDTGAQYGVCGRPAYEALCQELQKHGLKPQIVKKGILSAGGIGGQVKVMFTALIPFGFGAKTSGLMTLMVMENDVPPLIPIDLCRKLGMLLDLDAEKAVWRHAKSESKILYEPTGHISVDLFDFPPGGWYDPRKRMNSEQLRELPEVYQVRGDLRLHDSVAEDEPDTYSLVDHGAIWKRLRENPGGELAPYERFFPAPGLNKAMCIQLPR